MKSNFTSLVLAASRSLHVARASQRRSAFFTLYTIIAHSATHYAANRFADVRSCQSMLTTPTVPDGSTMGTPLAPSVEKAYYRKCIELKRRLNEVEASNDEARLRRIRLDRAIMKMRLERAFLLEQLSKRMDIDADNSDASGDEGVSTVR